MQPTLRLALVLTPVLTLVLTVVLTLGLTLGTTLGLTLGLVGVGLVARLGLAVALLVLKVVVVDD